MSPIGNYNPHSPRILGQEWAPIRDEQLQYSPNVNAVELGTTYVQSTSETLGTARFYANQAQATTQSFQVGLVGIYPAGTEDLTGPIGQVTIPCSDTTSSGSGISTSGSVSIEEAVYQPGDSLWVFFDYNASARDVNFWFNVSDYPVLANKRILNVSLMYSGAVYDVDPDTQNFIEFIDPNPSTSATIIYQEDELGVSQIFSPPTFLANTGVLTLATTVNNPTMTAAGSQTINALDLGDINNFWIPSLTPMSNTERLPWRYDDLLRFDDTFAGTARQHIRLRVQTPITAGTALATGYPQLRIDYMALRVIYCEEKRVIYGGKRFGYNLGVNSITLRDRSQNSSPVLPAGTYLPTLSWVSAGQVDYGQNASGDFPYLNATRELYQIPSHIGTQVNVPFPLEDRLGDTFTSQETHVLPQLSLHSTSATMVDPHVYGRRVDAQVYGSNVATQDIYDVGVAVATYPQVRFYARRYGELEEGTSGMLLPGGSGDYASTPDNAALDIVGDIDLRVDATLSSWVDGTYQGLISKWDASTQFSYRLTIDNIGQIQLAWSTTGAAGGIAANASSIPVTPPPSGRLAIRVTMDVNDGGGNRIVTFYTAPTIAGPWTQLGALGGGAATSIFAGTSALEVGADPQGSANPTAGMFHAVEIYNGIAGTAVANPNFAAQPAGTTSFTDAAGRTWTLQGDAEIVDASSLTLVGSSPGGLVPGGTGNDATTPDTAALDITGDIDLQADITLYDWTPAVFTPLIGKWTDPNQRSYLLSIDTSGVLALNWSADGTTVNFKTSTASVPWTSGRHVVRVTLDVDNGAAGNTVTFYTAEPGPGGQITQLGAPVVTAGVTSIFNSTSVARAGWNMIGTMHSAQILNGISGTAVANPDFSAQPAGTTSFADAAGRTWTLQGTATIVAGTEGSSVSITASEFDELPEILDGYKEITKRFVTPPSMGGGGNPSWTWMAPGVDPGNRWEILGACAPAVSEQTGTFYHFVPAPNDLGPATYQPSMGSGVNLTWMPQGIGSPWVTGATDDSTSDAVILFAQDLPAVTGMAVTVLSQPISGVGQKCDLDPAFIPTALDYIYITWSPTSSAIPVSGFGFYELQRMDELTEWQTIAKMTSPSASGFNDYEARIGIQSDYRIRAVDMYDFANDWSSTVSTTITSPGVTAVSVTSEDHVLVFTSNASQTGAYNLAYCLAWNGSPNEEFTFPEAGFTQMQAMYNKDFFTAFRPLERGGEQFSRQILVQAAAISPETLADFTSLRDMAWASVPYVCVRDEDGNRWLATVTVPSGRVRNNRTLYFADVAIAEVTQTAAEIEV